jgi:DNA-binding transcriptional MerR regulator
VVQYKIGDVARILGISRDLLRYYEKKGVVRPKKDKSNDYRYYEAWDINFLLDCVWYKNFGFSIEQTARMVTNCPYDELLEDLNAKKDEIEATLKHQQMLMRRIDEHTESVGRIVDYLGKCEIKECPEIVCYLNRYNFIYDNRPELQALSQRWLNYMPFTKRYFEINKDDLLGDSDNYAWGFSLDMEYVRELGVPADPPVVHLPACRSIHSAFKSSGKNGFTPRHIDYIVEYAEKNKLQICGNARGNLVCSVLENGVPTGYFEVWLPVKD